MITLTVQTKKTGKTVEECYDSIDKAKTRLIFIATSKTLALYGASYEEDEERALIKKYLPMED